MQPLLARPIMLLYFPFLSFPFSFSFPAFPFFFLPFRDFLFFPLRSFPSLSFPKLVFIHGLLCYRIFLVVGKSLRSLPLNESERDGADRCTKMAAILVKCFADKARHALPSNYRAIYVIIKYYQESQPVSFRYWGGSRKPLVGNSNPRNGGHKHCSHGLSFSGMSRRRVSGNGLRLRE